MGANHFTFRIPRELLQAVVAEMEARSWQEPEAELALQVSVQLTPDGVGYEMSAPKVEIVDVNEPMPT
jgi:hypothetical protein